MVLLIKCWSFIMMKKSEGQQADFITRKRRKINFSFLLRKRHWWSFYTRGLLPLE